MSKTTKQTRDQLQKPERQKFANSYISFCALYLLDGTQYTFLHKYLIDKIQEIRSPEEEDKMLTYAFFWQEKNRPEITSSQVCSKFCIYFFVFFEL